MGTAYLEDMTVDMLGLGPNRRARGRQWPYAHVLPAWYLEEGGCLSIYSDVSFTGTAILDINLILLVSISVAC